MGSRIWGVATLALLLGWMGPASIKANGWLRDIDHALSVAASQQRPIVLFVTTDRCTHCYRMIETTFRDSTVRRTLGQSFVAAAIKGSERPDLMKQLKIRSYPTTLLVSSQGKVLDQMVGYVDAKTFHRRLTDLRQPTSLGATPHRTASSRYATHKSPVRP